jgi:hypothetical protein
MLLFVTMMFDDVCEMAANLLLASKRQLKRDLSSTEGAIWPYTSKRRCSVFTTTATTKTAQQR